MKIVYCTDSVCILGGVEIVTIVKANALAKIAGNEVWIVVAACGFVFSFSAWLCEISCHSCG